jgi:hypothetical protein
MVAQGFENAKPPRGGGAKSGVSPETARLPKSPEGLLMLRDIFARSSLLPPFSSSDRRIFM